MKLVVSMDLTKNHVGKYVLKVFTCLGSIIKPWEDDLELFEKLLLNLYCIKKVPSNIQTSAELRSHMFSKRQVDSNKLLPAIYALKEKVSQAHYISLQWKSSHINNPSFPNLYDYGWCFNENTIV